MGGVVLGILVWQEGGEAVAALLAVGVVALGGLAYGWSRKRTADRPDRSRPVPIQAVPLRRHRADVQQIALGGTMIVLPIYLQMVLAYNAMQAGLSIAPLSLSMFVVALLAGRRAG